MEPGATSAIMLVARRPQAPAMGWARLDAALGSDAAHHSRRRESRPVSKPKVREDKVKPRHRGARDEGRKMKRKVDVHGESEGELGEESAPEVGKRRKSAAPPESFGRFASEEAATSARAIDELSSASQCSAEPPRGRERVEILPPIVPPKQEDKLKVNMKNRACLGYFEMVITVCEGHESLSDEDRWEMTATLADLAEAMARRKLWLRNRQFAGGRPNEGRTD